MSWVTDDVRGPAPTSGLVDVLNCRQLCPNDVLGHLDDTLQSFLVLSGAAGIPRCDAVCQDTLHCTQVKVHEKKRKNRGE